MADKLRVGVTRDFLDEDGRPAYPHVSLASLDGETRLEWEFIPENVGEITPSIAARYDAIVSLGPRYTETSLTGADRRLALISRFGVGYDNVDVAACNAAGVILTITPDGVRRPMAQVVLTLILACAGRLLQKDRMTRESRWGDRPKYMGVGITGKTLGFVGMGNIGREAVQMIAPFDMRIIAADPYANPDQLRALAVELVSLETVMRESDFVSVNCMLNAETHHLINAQRLALMKPSAFLINTARGPIVDEAALVDTLRRRAILGAGLDVLEQEPSPPDNPLYELDNVIVAPHALGWTDECFAGNGAGACEAVIDLANGRVPRHVVNREVLSHPWLTPRLRPWG
jgi:D-3-phosphoglycerate dehydrogenase